jgi:hypothetical protein
MKIRKKIYKKIGGLTITPFGKFMLNTHKWELCVVTYIPDNKWLRKKYLKNFLT